jgi:hypothetical protein
MISGTGIAGRCLRCGRRALPRFRRPASTASRSSFRKGSRCISPPCTRGAGAGRIRSPASRAGGGLHARAVWRGESGVDAGSDQTGWWNRRWNPDSVSATCKKSSGLSQTLCRRTGHFRFPGTPSSMRDGGEASRCGGARLSSGPVPKGLGFEYCKLSGFP